MPNRADTYRQRGRDLLAFAVLVLVVHFGSIALGLNRTWWATVEPWVLLDERGRDASYLESDFAMTGMASSTEIHLPTPISFELCQMTPAFP